MRFSRLDFNGDGYLSQEEPAPKCGEFSLMTIRKRPATGWSACIERSPLADLRLSFPLHGFVR
ncbi:MAG: hypothetical protein U0350_28645 [Caldilineaceae bacterium]